MLFVFLGVDEFSVGFFNGSFLVGVCNFSVRGYRYREKLRESQVKRKFKGRGNVAHFRFFRITTKSDQK